MDDIQAASLKCRYNPVLQAAAWTVQAQKCLPYLDYSWTISSIPYLDYKATPVLPSEVS